MKIRKIMLLSVLTVFAVALAFSTSFAEETAKLKALIIDGQNNHNWRETTPVLKKDLEDTGRFTVDVATSPDHGQDMSQFKPNFAAYDVIVLNYNGDDWCEETKKAFEEYMKNGGGMVAFHAADNSFPKWEEFNKMIAVGGWGGRNKASGPYLYWKDGKQVVDYETNGTGGNHGAQHEFLIEVRDPEHPIMKGMPLKFRHCRDELYEQLRGPAENVTILATAWADPKQWGDGRDEPQLMVISYGKGRVFHIAMGHAGIQCKSVSFIAPFVRGTEWAATGEVTIPVPEDMPGEDKPVLRLP